MTIRVYSLYESIEIRESIYRDINRQFKLTG
jgi:hypothetical protein